MISTNPVIDKQIAIARVEALSCHETINGFPSISKYGEVEFSFTQILYPDWNSYSLSDLMSISQYSSPHS